MYALTVLQGQPTIEEFSLAGPEILHRLWFVFHQIVDPEPYDADFSRAE